MFLRHRPCHFQPPPHQKFLLHLQYSHLKIVYTSRIVSLGRPSFAAILFVDWLVRILKVENFSGNYSDTSFFSISFKKNKNKKPPARIIFKKKVPEKHIINFFWPYRFYYLVETERLWDCKHPSSIYYLETDLV